MKKTIAQKRSQLYREWLLATLSNDEAYYNSTLMMGIPDGDDEDTVKEDLISGFYDDDIDETIEIYLSAKKRYGKGGYWVDERVVMDEDEALELAGYAIPERIYKNGKEV